MQEANPTNHAVIGAAASHVQHQGKATSLSQGQVPHLPAAAPTARAAAARSRALQCMLVVLVLLGREVR